MLSEDLQNAEKRVDVLKTVLQNLVKRLTASLHAHGVHDSDKRAVSVMPYQGIINMNRNENFCKGT